MRKSKGVVLFDMDGVLADFDSGTETFLRANYPSIAIVPRQNFYYRDDYSNPVHQQVISDLHSSRHFFESLPEIPGGVEAWHRAQNLGYETQISSAPLPSNEWCVDEKLRWVHAHLGAAAAKHAIIDADKYLNDAIALVDDKPIIKNASLARWQHIMYDRPYNTHIDTPFRLFGGNDANFESMLARCAALYERIS